MLFFKIYVIIKLSKPSNDQTMATLPLQHGFKVASIHFKADTSVAHVIPSNTP
jgi:hypothetical protein